MTDLTLPRDEFRQAMSRFATGVTVLTTHDGRLDHAMTANSITSVSLEPPLVLACIHNESRFLEAVREAKVWAVHVLASTQRPAADWLAVHGRPAHGQLDRVPHRRSESGVALLEEASATLECSTWQEYPGGDHAILVGRVETVHLPERVGEALLYYRGAYRTLD
ncbi:MAG: flavin reductase family protein [Dermatophilus congolensis]|nr:flavin reductase family protein [Dermatophilus congolensis]